MRKGKNAAAIGLCLLASVLALLYASTSSLLYATNFWTDSNIYFTIGRGMVSGLMPYRDLFDHKGPLTFLVYAAGALVSRTSFFGVWLMEIASMTAFLFVGWRTVERFAREDSLSLLAIPLLCAVTVCCRAFDQGGSAEEFCLPGLALGLYGALGITRETRAKDSALFGVGAAICFLHKFTTCGLFLGLGLVLFAWATRTRGFSGLLRMLLGMAAGFAAVLLPVVLWLAANGIMNDCFQVYILENLTSGYGEAGMSLTGHLYNALAYLRTQSIANPWVAGLAAFGAAFFALRPVGLWISGSRRRGLLLEMLLLPMGAGCMLLFCYWGEMAHPYYALIFAALVPAGMCVLGAVRLNRKAALAFCCAACLALPPLCAEVCQSAPLRSVLREAMPQTIFADIMEPGATLLDITSHDQGFYLAANVLPVCRYFADNNLETVEKREAISGYLAQGLTDYVVSRWADPGPMYEKIAEASGLFDLAELRTYYLYKRVEQ